MIDFVSFTLSNEDWNQMQSQEEDPGITEEDLELIKERESAIQKLEVSCHYMYNLTLFSLNMRIILCSKRSYCHCTLMHFMLPSYRQIFLM